MHNHRLITGLILMSEVTVSQRTYQVHDREAKAKVLSKANRLRSSIAGKAPQRAPLSSSSSTKLAPVGKARTEALFSANPFCRDKRSRTSSYAQSKRASALDCLSPNGSDLREFFTNKRKSESFRTTLPCCQQVGCQLVTVHSVHCRLGPISVTPPGRRSVFVRLSV